MKEVVAAHGRCWAAAGAASGRFHSLGNALVRTNAGNGKPNTRAKPSPQVRYRPWLVGAGLPFRIAASSRPITHWAARAVGGATNQWLRHP
ncbi:hypothetical protein LTT66_35225 [Nocardia gipuzkoensis]|uniref:hypothetical protein n=1 Tax=Nocardia gipuzkoensis TaxID=2749991 RepID=UPI001E37CA44|nr:hypothetical protein [Nocardia gipuzkoensis]UGT68339.1 hypothetical protein LTT66_35225 [Nocardia gipuzkoensis]